jgi:2-phosphosulfolactate phosphatase
VRIPGFDLGNSPFEYEPSIVDGKDVIFTTTNGTRALNRCEAARRILIGAFINMSALSRELANSSGDVLLCCAGNAGQLTAEDILFAGSIVEELTARDPLTFDCDIGAELSREFMRQRSKSESAWNAAMRSSRGGANLMSLGYEQDIERSITRDVFDIVPVWDAKERVLVAP